MRTALVVRPMVVALVTVAAMLAPASARAQMYSRCSSGDRAELEGNVREHAEETYRMEAKFLHVYYQSGPLPPGYAPATLDEVTRYLGRLDGRRAAVLYHARERSRACTWLITPGGIATHVADAGDGRPAAPPAVAMGEAAARPPEPAGPQRGVALEESGARPDDMDAGLRQTAATLFGPPILARLASERIDTLIVVPSGALGMVPFAALPLGSSPGERLVDRMSVWIAPGFASFRDDPAGGAPPRLSSAIVLGDPTLKRDKSYDLPPLPGARSEAQEVARLLGTRALVGADARYDRLEARVRGRDVGLVYIASHAVSDPRNPLDRSYLWLADGRRAPREIQHLPLAAGRPMVVLSACQTGLGKVFPVGSIGMARGWQRAGASSVVISLWRVDDGATRALMTEFLKLALEGPPDRALQQAMIRTRATYADPARWASFTVFGVPGPAPANAPAPTPTAAPTR